MPSAPRRDRSHGVGFGALSFAAGDRNDLDTIGSASSDEHLLIDPRCREKAKPQSGSATLLYLAHALARHGLESHPSDL
jgi:hypothetical protein